VAGTDGTAPLKQTAIRSILAQFPRLAVTVHSHPSLRAFVTFKIAGGTPRCFSTAVQQNILRGE
jgi:hypothetical protein